MATDATLRPGGSYFMVAFEDASFRRPIITTLEYIGPQTDGVSHADGAGYIFRLVGSEGDQLMLEQSQIWQALDIEQLIQKLADFRDGEIQ